MAWGDGQGWQNVMSREELRDRVQDAAQIFFDKNGKGVSKLPPPPPPPKTDYLPFIIGGAATIVAALIVTRKK